MKYTIVSLLFTACFAAFSLFACNHERDQIEAELEVIEDGEDRDKGFARAFTPRTFHFPQDHGPHGEYRIEWWYYTGNLQTDKGRYFGYQLTFFRLGLLPYKIKRSSSWAAHEIYMAHFTVTDTARDKFHSFERFSRAALGLAGAQTDPFCVWLEDWTVIGHKDNAFAMDLKAQQDSVSLELTVTSAKPAVLQGNKGLSQKSPEPGNASYYYSLTRLLTEGTVSIGSEIFHVHGLSWMDREWSTSALGDNQQGWDWFSLQLSDKTEIMYYQLRKDDGTIDPLSTGTLISQNGQGQKIKHEDVTIEILKYWRTPDSEAKYPSQWKMNITSQEIELYITPRVVNQEVNHTVRYWEGSVEVKGHIREKKITGSGYVELTGYSGDISERM